MTKDNWEKPRGRHSFLTDAEREQLRQAFVQGRKASDIARELKCSSRVANKYYAQFRGQPYRDSRFNSRPSGEERRPFDPVQARRERFYTSNFEPS